jgi:uncharacterized membrane protein
MFALLAGALVVLLILIQIRAVRFAYMQLGVGSGTAFFLLLGSLLGSYINIPIATLGEEAMVTEREVTYFSMHYIVPELVQRPEVILAVNVGGAIIPTILSIYLLAKNGLWGRGLIATFLIAAICMASRRQFAESESGCLSSCRLWLQPSSLRSFPGVMQHPWLTREEASAC